jgi:hypothetical protein
LYSTYLNGYQEDSRQPNCPGRAGNTYAGDTALALAATNPLSNNGGAFVIKLRQAGAPPFSRQSITNGASFLQAWCREWLAISSVPV